MIFILFFTVTSVCAAALSAHKLAPIHRAPAHVDVVPDSFLVKFEDNSPHHLSNAVKELSERDSIDFLQAEPCSEFSVLLAKTSSAQDVTFLRQLPGVAHIEENSRIRLPTHVEGDRPRNRLESRTSRISDSNYPSIIQRIARYARSVARSQVDVLAEDSSFPVEQLDPPWGLDRLDQRRLPLDNLYVYANNSGEDVDVYVLDTGIKVQHPEFEGRARYGACFLDVGENTDTCDTDVKGHGTQVAGIVGSRKYGVAKNSNLISVKILNDTGDGSKANAILGMHWVCQQHVASGKRASVVNLSVGGDFSLIQQEAVGFLHQYGVVVVIAAGNDQDDACLYSPSGSPDGITVMATDITDKFASGYSNFGPCTDILAPGTEVETADVSAGGVAVSTGTSFSAPHVSGVAAHIIAANARNETLTAESVKQHLLGMATEGVVKGLPDTADGLKSPNLLLFSEPPDSDFESGELLSVVITRLDMHMSFAIILLGSLLSVLWFKICFPEKDESYKYRRTTITS